MTTKTYNRLRYFTQIVLPAVAAFIVTVCEVWNISGGDKVAGTIAAVVTLLSGILGISSAIYDKEGGKYDGDCDFSVADNLRKYVHISNMASTECSEEKE